MLIIFYLLSIFLNLVDPLKNDLNIVIFFTHVDPKCAILQKNSLKFLHIHEATRVKHCAEDEEPVPSTEKPKHDSEFCKELLKDSLMSLTHYCHTVMKMKTAVASVSSKEMTNDIQEPQADLVEIKHRPSRSDNPQVEENYSIKPPEPPTGEDNVKSTGKNFITGTKHTEVFQIRVKRNFEGKKQLAETTIEEPSTCKHRPKPSAWDALDIMKHVRYSFLGDMFGAPLKVHSEKDQDDIIDISVLGKEKKDAGLFSMVQSTLDTLLDPPEASFLMVIFGGHLHSVTNQHSPIVQSIKYVLENTDPEKTLIIVTGSCADDSDLDNGEPTTVPVYAKGPRCDVLSECKLLYDIPLIVRKILEIHSGSDLSFSEHLR